MAMGRKLAIIRKMIRTDKPSPVSAMKRHRVRASPAAVVTTGPAACHERHAMKAAIKLRRRATLVPMIRPLLSPDRHAAGDNA
jgi:hypothetical protein